MWTIFFCIDVGERRRIIGWDESIEASHIERIGCGVIADIDIIDGCIMGISEGTAIIEACVSTSCGNISYRWKVVVSDPEAISSQMNNGDQRERPKSRSRFVPL